MSSIKPMGIRQWSMLLILSLLWGGSFFFMKVALVDVPTFSIVFLRVSSAALVLYFYLRLCGLKIPRQFKVWRLFLLLGLFNNLLPFSLLIYGMTEIASGLASILNATTPLFTILVAHIATTDERISTHKVLGILSGMLGVCVLIGVEVFSGVGNSLWAMLACIAAAISYAIASIFGRKFQQYAVQPSVGAFGQVLSSSVLLVPLVVLLDSPWQLSIPSAESLWAIAALGVLSTALAYVIFFKLIAEAGATNAVLVTLLVPVSAILLGWVFLQEQLTTNQFIGMGLIAVGLLAIDGRLFKARLKKLS